MVQFSLNHVPCNFYVKYFNKASINHKNSYILAAFDEDHIYQVKDISFFCCHLWQAVGWIRGKVVVLFLWASCSLFSVLDTYSADISKEQMVQRKSSDVTRGRFSSLCHRFRELQLERDRTFSLSLLFAAQS